MKSVDDEIHKLVSLMDGLARTSCGIYVNANNVTTYIEQLTCLSCVEGKENPLRKGRINYQ